MILFKFNQQKCTKLASSIRKVQMTTSGHEKLKDSRAITGERERQQRKLTQESGQQCSRRRRLLLPATTGDGQQASDFG